MTCYGSRSLWTTGETILHYRPVHSATGKNICQKIAFLSSENNKNWIWEYLSRKQVNFAIKKDNSSSLENALVERQGNYFRLECLLHFKNSPLFSSNCWTYYVWTEGKNFVPTSSATSISPWGPNIITAVYCNMGGDRWVSRNLFVLLLSGYA